MKARNHLSQLFFLLFSLVLLSCEKSSDVKDVFHELNSLTKEVIAKPTLQEMRQGLAMLSVEEREVLWKVKLNFILSNKEEKFTPEQRKIVVQLQDFLSETGMEQLMKNPNLGNGFLDENLAYYSKHFSKEQLNILVESPYLKENLVISAFTLTDMMKLTTPKGGVSNNIITVRPNYIGKTETGSCTCLYDMGCPGPSNYCENTGCTTNNSYEMCGMFGTSSCTKRCGGAEPNLSPDPLGGNPY